MSTYDDEDYESFDLDDEVDPDDVDDSDDPEDDDDEDDLEDATDDEIDFVMAFYREDGLPVVTSLAKDLANDLEELIEQLRRLPGDAGAIGLVSLIEEVFVIVRVRGRRIQVLLSDGTAAGEYPIARDVADYLGIEIPGEDDDPEPMGDLDVLADLGVSGFDMGLFCDTADSSSVAQLGALADRLKVGRQFHRVVETEFAS